MNLFSFVKQNQCHRSLLQELYYVRHNHKYYKIVRTLDISSSTISRLSRFARVRYTCNTHCSHVPGLCNPGTALQRCSTRTHTGYGAALQFGCACFCLTYPPRGQIVFSLKGPVFLFQDDRTRVLCSYGEEIRLAPLAIRLFDFLLISLRIQHLIVE
jgi:hypothetical protein